MADDFFDEQEEQSRVKAAIVVDYFIAWANILASRSDRIAYIDLFAGPGRYKDGGESTPLLLLKRIIASPKLAAKTATIFNDSNAEYSRQLQAEIDSLPGIDTLAHPPDVNAEEVGERLAELFSRTRMVPTLTFIDPWGYKGLSRRLIEGVIKNFGCEAVFFFNYNRINAAVDNELVEPHMEALFSPARLVELRGWLRAAEPASRESLILRALGDSLQELGGELLLPFRFLREGGRVSHYVCFVTKNKVGYAIMKDIMAKHGAVDEDGVPRFEYFPAVKGRQLVFETHRPLLQLPEDLLRTFAGQTLSVQQIFDNHNVGKPFLKKHYKVVLLHMESARRIRCSPADRTKDTLANKTLVTFP